jgi:hypothetical protein
LTIKANVDLSLKVCLYIVLFGINLDDSRV